MSSPRPAGAVLVGAPVLQPQGTGALERICRASGAKALYETFPARMTRGGGRFEPRRLVYPVDLATKQLADVEHLVLIGTVEPVAFFGYPGKPGRLVPRGCTVHTLAEPGTDAPGALDELASIMGGDTGPAGAGGIPVLERPSGPIDASSAAAAVAATLPEGAIVSDEGTTCGMYMLGATRRGPWHDWLNITGGAIGQGMPVATGAALACGDRPVLNIQSDGSAMYTIQALWTQAREQLDVTTLLCNNGAYSILAMELDQVGAAADGPVSRSLLDLGRPDLDFCRLAEGQGVPAVRVATAEELCDQLERAYRQPGPHLIEAMFRIQRPSG